MRPPSQGLEVVVRIAEILLDARSGSQVAKWFQIKRMAIM
jgi:hypothetical protein